MEAVCSDPTYLCCCCSFVITTCEADKIKVLINFSKVLVVVVAAATDVVVAVADDVVATGSVAFRMLAEQQPRVHLLFLVADGHSCGCCLGKHRSGRNGCTGERHHRHAMVPPGERVRGVDPRVAGGAQRCSVGAARQHGRGALAGLADAHTLMARGHTVGGVHPRIAGCAEVRGIGAAVHHAWRRAAPIARLGPWATPFSTTTTSSSNLLLENTVAKIIIHERRDLATCTAAPRRQFSSLSSRISDCVMSMLGKSPMPEVQCRVLIAGCQENPGSDTWHRLMAQRCCVPILWLALDVAASLFCPDETSRFRIEI